MCFTNAVLDMQVSVHAIEKKPGHMVETPGGYFGYTNSRRLVRPSHVGIKVLIPGKD